MIYIAPTKSTNPRPLLEITTAWDRDGYKINIWDNTEQITRQTSRMQIAMSCKYLLLFVTLITFLYSMST